MSGSGNIVRLVFSGDTTDLQSKMKSVGQSADEMVKGFSLKSAGLAIAGSEAGKGLVEAFGESLDFQAANAKLQAQMGAGTPAAAQAGRVAGGLYANNFGDSMEQVGDAVKLVMQSSIAGVGATDGQVQALTGSVMNLSKAFGVDTEGAVNAVAQMMRTGLATDGGQALDILTAGFQAGDDKAGDLLDTVNEYGTQFRGLGLSGAQAMGLISQGLKGGARDADVVADSLKEFRAQAISGSKTVSQGFSELGMNAKTSIAAISGGGPAAAQTLDTVLDRLRSMRDPVEKNKIGLALFATKWEDLGAAVDSLDPSTATQALGQVGGAAQKMGDALNDTAESKVAGAQRAFHAWEMSLVGVQGPLGSVAAQAIGLGGTVMPVVGNLGMLVAGLSSVGVEGLKSAGSMALTAAKWVGSLLLMIGQGAIWVATSVAQLAVWGAGVVAQGAVAAGSMALTAARWVGSMVMMAASGAVQVGVMLGQLTMWAAGVVAQGAVAVGSMIVTGASYVAEWVVMAVSSMASAVTMAAAWFVALGPIGWVTAGVIALAALVIANWSTVSAWTSAAWSAVAGYVGAAWSAVAGFVAGGVGMVLGWIGRLAALPGMVGGYFAGMASAAVGYAGSLISFVAGIPGRILGALGNVGSLLVGAGRSLIQGFWNGIQSMISWVYNQVSSALGSIRNLFPFSPAKEGPFSGTGYTTHSGAALMEGFGQGITSQASSVHGAASAVMQGAHAAVNGGAGGGGGGMGRAQVTFSGNTSDALATVIMQMVRTGKIQIQT